MANRLAAMIGIMQTSLKTGSLSCETPTNKIGLQVLRLLREQGLIYGFNYVFTRTHKTRLCLYPRVRIFFKYTDTVLPIIRKIKVFKHTPSNYVSFPRSKLIRALSQNKSFILSTTHGLTLTSYEELYRKSNSSLYKSLSGKLLLEIILG